MSAGARGLAAAVAAGPAAASGGLLVLAALGIEALAIRSALSSASALCCGT